MSDSGTSLRVTSNTSTELINAQGEENCFTSPEINRTEENEIVYDDEEVPEAKNESIPGENSDITTSNETPTNNSSPTKPKRRSKHRAGRYRKWKWRPYYKLSCIERLRLQERDARRAQRVRDEMSASGIVLAPNNTTQFLMNDHNIQEPDYGRIHKRHKYRDRRPRGDSSDEYYSYSDDDDYINQQFMEDYESYHDQYLNNLSREELINQWLDLEDKIDVLKKKITLCRNQIKPSGSVSLDADAEMEKIQVFREEIRKITIENVELEKMNVELQNSLYGCL